MNKYILKTLGRCKEQALKIKESIREEREKAAT